MIISAVIQLLALVFMWLVSVIPPLPALPQAVTDIGTFLSNFLGGGFGIVAYIYGAPLFNAIIVMTLALIFFNQGYRLVMFILHKMKLIG